MRHHALSPCFRLSFLSGLITSAVKPCTIISGIVVQTTVTSFRVGWNFSDGESIASAQDVYATQGQLTAVTLANSQVRAEQSCQPEQLNSPDGQPLHVVLQLNAHTPPFQLNVEQGLWEVTVLSGAKGSATVGHQSEQLAGSSWRGVQLHLHGQRVGRPSGPHQPLPCCHSGGAKTAVLSSSSVKATNQP